MKKNNKGIIFGIVLTVLSLALCIGVKTAFKACGPMENGMYMNCRKAENAAVVAGAVLAVLSVLIIAIKNKGARVALSALTAVGAVVSAILPNNVIKLCMMDTMHCHTAMRPFIVVVSVIIAVVSAVSLIVNAVSKD